MWLKEKDGILIYKKHLAGYLLMMGCKLNFVCNGKEYKRKYVFYFADTEHTHKMLKMYYGR